MKDELRIAGILPSELPGMAAADRPDMERLAARLSSLPSEELDRAVHREHRHQFGSIDCLDCANCCRTTPALLLQEDMERIAGRLGITVSEFLHRYVEMDEDGDFVTKGTPCPFLLEDNACSIYEFRPASCRDFPLTLRPDQASILEISLENRAVCPAVYRIFEQLGELY